MKPRNPLNIAVIISIMIKRMDKGNSRKQIIRLPRFFEWENGNTENGGKLHARRRAPNTQLIDKPSQTFYLLHLLFIN